MKGKAGNRVHYLDKFRAPSWGSSACGRTAGLVRIVDESTPVTCPHCRKLNPAAIVCRTIPNGPEYFP